MQGGEERGGDARGRAQAGRRLGVGVEGEEKGVDGDFFHTPAMERNQKLVSAVPTRSEYF